MHREIAQNRPKLTWARTAAGLCSAPFVRPRRAIVAREESNAGIGSGLKDEEYVAQGAQIVGSAKEAWSADMVVKVKEPLPAEYGFFRENLVLYTYLHLAPEPELTRELAGAGAEAGGWDWGGVAARDGAGVAGGAREAGARGIRSGSRRPLASCR